MSWLTILKAAPWVLAGLCLVGLLWFRGEYEGEKAARAADLLAAQKAALDAKARDAERTRALLDTHAAELSTLKEQADARARAILAATNSNTCLASPPVRAMLDELRLRNGGAPGAGQPRPAR